ncbi:MAG TPA: endonuclease III, partial [Thermomicrobiales bacterium]|nr:endonuclease III [Thermomicrobiales bacterium]
MNTKSSVPRDPLADHLENFATISERIAEVARRLDLLYGPHDWHPYHPPIDQLVVTILSQHTSDTNTDRAFASLRARFSTWEEVIAAPTGAVADAIRSGGLADQKAPRIQGVLVEVLRKVGSFDLTFLRDLPVPEARAWLMQLHGVGPKTASCVLLFSLGMPAMPVDTHVHRVARRIGLIGPDVTAEAAHTLLEEALGGDHARVYAFHVNMIAHGRAICTARRPFCERCSLTDC